MGTIYTAAGVKDPAAGLHAAVRRANAAVVRMRRTVPDGVPVVGQPDRPEAPAATRTRVWYDRYGDSYGVQALSNSCDPASWTGGSVDHYITCHTGPEELLDLTERAEGLAIACERTADAHEAAVIAATAAAVAAARPALESLRQRSDVARMAEDLRELKERVAELEKGE